MGMGPITAIIPQPTTVRIGNEDYRMGELRLSGLARLQAFLDDRYGDPISHLREKLHNGISDIETERELALIYKKWDAPYPFVFGEFTPREPGVRLDSAVEFIRVALSQYHDPDITTEEVRDILEELQPGQLSKISKVVWGTAPVEEIGKLFGWRLRRHRSNLLWPKAIVEVLQNYPGYTLASLYETTLTEFWYLRSGGKDRTLGEWEIRGSIAQAAEERRAWWQRLMGTGK